MAAAALWNSSRLIIHERHPPLDQVNDVVHLCSRGSAGGQRSTNSPWEARSVPRFHVRVSGDASFIACSAKVEWA